MTLVTKAFAINSQTGEKIKDSGEASSKQIQDPFSGMAGYGRTLMIPPVEDLKLL